MKEFVISEVKAETAVAFAVIGKREVCKTFPEMDLILANVEMLSRAESPYDCILAKDECKSEIRRKNK